MNATLIRHRKLTVWSRRTMACATALLVVDQATKWAASTTTCGPVICPLSNDSLMLGIGSGSNVNVVIVGGMGLGLVVGWVLIVSRRHVLPAVAVALAVAGTISNLIDRLLVGSVRDFLTVPGNAVINLADIGVIGGLVACTVALLRARLTSDSRQIERG